tara:strand:- start:52 stop:3150 length:3099 start_codon:yes stop_codon:yes gene_type:complete
LENKSRRLSVLTPSEQKIIYGLPILNSEERKYYFWLTDADQEIIDTQIRGLESKVYYILQLIYFKISFRFFKFRFSDVTQDIDYILKKYFSEEANFNFSKIFDKRTIWKQQSIILKIFSYKLSSKKEEERFLTLAKSTVLIDANPRYIFKEIVRFAYENKIIVPAYTNIQLIISKAIVTQEAILFEKLNNLISDELRMLIDNLLQKEDETRYSLTLIKSPPKSFSYGHATEERKKRDTLTPIFEKAKLILEHLRISPLSTKYFASLVDQYTIYKLNRFDNIKRYFYILCFVYYRYLSINDSLIKTYLYLVGKYKSEVTEEVKQKIFQMRLENSNNLKKGATIFRLIANDKNIKPGQLAQDLRSEVFSILSANKINKLADYLEKSDVDFEDFKWNEYDKKYDKIKRNLRHIFKDLTLNTNVKGNNLELYKSALFFQEFLQENNNKMESPPADFIPKHLEKYLYEKVDKKKSIITHRYEVLLYRMLKNKIDSSDIFIYNSINYRSMESDLIELNHFIKNEKKIVENLNSSFLKGDFAKIIQEKLKILEKEIEVTNQNILDGKNDHFKFASDHKRDKWHLEYEGVGNKDINNPIFSKLPKIDIVDLMLMVNKKTTFLSAFTHILNRYSKSGIDEMPLIGALIAYATNMGIGKMAFNSNLEYNQLKGVKNSRLREETLKEANEIIINATAKLPIQKIYNINDQIHSSIDGKKYEAMPNIFNARYSPKYFGLNKGISVMTLVANFQPVALKIISPNEYEGNFNLELLMMNESDMQPSINSTDMHGINEINHALHDFANYDFQPRYTDIYKQAQNICGAKDFSKYPDHYIIKPNYKINTQLMTDEGFNIRRIVASMMTKTCTVSTIVKKLSSSMKSNKTRKAIAEYNKILRSIHILKTINNPHYRQNMQVALNRGESYHQFVGAVSYANGGKIISKTENDQLIFKECSRLICNVILYYNSHILSQFYLQKLKENNIVQINALKGVSPASWNNINLHGKYEFNKNSSNISFSSLNKLIKSQILVDDILDDQEQETIEED